jgi:hypothetical protein
MLRPPVLKRLVTVAVLMSLCSALLVLSNTPARAAKSKTPQLVAGKISHDLQRLILSGNGDERVKVIVQSKSSSTGLLGGLLDTVEGLLVNVLSNLNIRIVEVQASAVNLLATDPDVSFISLDVPVRSSGHITTTTGTQLIRAQ